VYVNGRHIGTYQLPATIPVLASGNQWLSVSPGIYNNGIKQLKSFYMFYTQYNQDIDLVPGQVQTVRPVVSYRNDIAMPFKINENFSGNTLDLQTPAGSVYQLEVSDDPALQFANSEGRVGVVYSKTDTLMPIIIESHFMGRLPQGNAAVYLEFDFKSTLDLRVGLEVNSQGQTFRVQDLVLFGNRDWNKVYVNLTKEISQVNNPNATFRVYIQARPRGSNQDFVAIDNVRLIHF
jgi:hypothetical protein